MIYLLTPLCFLIDQFSKERALEMIPYGREIEKLNGKLKLQIVYNEGAFLGIMKRRKKLLMLMNIVALILLIVSVSVLTLNKGLTVVKMGAALIYGGALGNIYDRVKRKKVVDFFAIELIPNVYFNIADLFIFAGGIMLIISYMYYD